MYFDETSGIRFCMSERGTCDYIDCLEINNDSLKTEHWVGNFNIDTTKLPVTENTSLGRGIYIKTNCSDAYGYGSFSGRYATDYVILKEINGPFFAIRAKSPVVFPKTISLLIRFNINVTIQSVAQSFSALNKNNIFLWILSNDDQEKNSRSYTLPLDKIKIDLFFNSLNESPYIPQTPYLNDCWDNDHFCFTFCAENDAHCILTYEQKREKVY